MNRKSENRISLGLGRFVSAPLRWLKRMLLIPILGGIVISIMSMIMLVVMWLFMRRDLEQKAAATHNGPVERPSPPTPAATLPKPGPPPKAKPAADNLRKIKGIGPKTDGVLQAAGITTFAALADTAVEKLQAVLDEAGVAKSVKPATWPEQARKQTGH